MNIKSKKKYSGLISLLLLTNILLAQDTLQSVSENKTEKGRFVLGFSVGVSFANFLNSEAPYKINLYGSEIQPVMVTPTTKTQATFDYNTSLFKDINTGICTGITFEYFITNNISINSGLYYEAKGTNLDYNTTKSLYYNPTTMTDYRINETCQIKIDNDYLTYPLLFRKYFFKKNNLFIEEGVYFGNLISSHITIYQEKSAIDNTFPYYYHFSMDNIKDEEKEFTNKFDYGISFGTGYHKNLTSKLTFNISMRVNIGLKKLDAKFDNEYEEQSIISGPSSYVTYLRSTNYFGLNSDSKNINMALTAGLGYVFGS